MEFRERLCSGCGSFDVPLISSTGSHCQRRTPRRAGYRHSTLRSRPPVLGHPRTLRSVHRRIPDRFVTVAVLFAIAISQRAPFVLIFPVYYPLAVGAYRVSLSPFSTKKRLAPHRGCDWILHTRRFMTCRLSDGPLPFPLGGRCGIRGVRPGVPCAKRLPLHAPCPYLLCSRHGSMPCAALSPPDSVCVRLLLLSLCSQLAIAARTRFSSLCSFHSIAVWLPFLLRFLTRQSRLGPKWSYALFAFLSR